MRFPSAARAGAVGLVLLGCSDPSGPPSGDPITELPRSLSVAEQEVVNRSNGFGLELFRRVTAADERANVVLSPLSASMALGMTLNGARDETLDAMRATLGFDGLSADEINDSYRDLIDLLTGLDPEVRFDIANAIWANEEVTFREAFFETVRAAFDAEAAARDFSDAATLEEINAWVDERTEGFIETILDDLDPDLAMLLVNAIYFDGTWTTEFDPDDTEPGPFTRADGSTVTVDMMELTDAEVALGAGSGYQAAELPYGGGAFAMTVVVPQDDPRAFVADLDQARWDSIVESLGEPREIDLLSMPKLSLAYDALLNDALRDMGMDRAFTTAADFSGMSETEQLCLDFVRQKTMLEVDEAGTRAAAATTVGVGPTSFNGLVVDRPYVLAIRERFSGTILFVGLVGDPTVEDSGRPEAQQGCIA
ncbi:MAG: serpin family protein [Gemmatimonadota bacterium]|nr:serpin family protein [Gemmatimonadota bacterium]